MTKFERLPLVALATACLSVAQPPLFSAEEKPPPEKIALLERIREMHLIWSKSAEEDFHDYDAIVPLNSLPYRMIAIQGGIFSAGSPPHETGRRQDEGPQIKVEVDSFWMGQCEITWEIYDSFLDSAFTASTRLKMQKSKDLPSTIDDTIFATTHPSEIITYKGQHKIGERGSYPAVNMTRYAASKFCEWLSFHTGRWYRLPTEMEWEYACRAGTSTAYHFGNDPQLLSQYDVYDPIGTRTGPEEVRSKKPNPWGLYDMHGNVVEWCVDQYAPTRYQEWLNAGQPARNPFVGATTLFYGSVRGGSWYDDADLCRSAVRSFSHPDWQGQYFPESIGKWWLSQADWLGFRILSPKAVPSAEEIFSLWKFDFQGEE